MLHSFHSIGIPSEWGRGLIGTNFDPRVRFPFNWDPQRVGTRKLLDGAGLRFWVSIQLGSPASGDFKGKLPISISGTFEFPFNWDPQRVGTGVKNAKQAKLFIMFPFNWDPQRVGTVGSDRTIGIGTPVSIQLGSPASGDLESKVLNRRVNILGFHSIGIPSEWGLRGCSL